MTSIVKFTPVSGVKDEAPLCYMLDIDNFRFMLDCGWDEDCSMDFIERLTPYVSFITWDFLASICLTLLHNILHNGLRDV